jgi:hypothetical protein
MGISKEKKREYNERYRSKLRNKEVPKEEPEKQPEKQPEPEPEKPRVEVISEPEEVLNDDMVTISKQELFEYIQRIRALQTPAPEPEPPQEPEEKKKVLTSEESIVTKIQNSFINSTISTLSSMILPLSVLLISNYLPTQSKPSLAPKPQSLAPQETFTAPFQIPTGNLY